MTIAEVIYEALLIDSLIN